MAQPTYDEQISLEYLVNGLPTAIVTGNPTTIADGLHYLVNGLPFYAVSPGGVTPPAYNASQFFMLF